MGRTIIEQALNSAELSILVLDDNGQIIESTASTARLLCIESEKLRGKSVFEFLRDLPLGQFSHDRCSPQPKRLKIDVVACDALQREFLVAVTANYWADAHGRPLVTLVIRDVGSERDSDGLAHRQLLLSDNAIRGANIGVFEYDPTTNSIAVSDIWRRMLEIDPDDDVDVQVEWRGRVHPDDLCHALEPIRLCSEGEANKASCEYRLQSRDRLHWKWMRTDIAVAQRDENGTPCLLVGAQTDISERKSMEDALRISVDQFRSAFFNAPIGKAIVGLDGTQLMVNPALCELLGYSESQLVNSKFQILTHPEDLEEDLRQLKLLVEGKIHSYKMEKRYYRANGAIMWGLLCVGLVRDSEGKPDHLISQVVDITEQRRLEELKNEFVSVVSHELRTPLTSILGALTLLDLEGDDALSDEVQRLLFIAKTNGERLHHLINDILDFQKFSAKQMRFSLSPHPVAAIIEEALLANLASADKYGVQFSPRINDRSLIGRIDPKRFHQVMANLLSNAAKFADRGSKVEVAAELLGPNIRVSVSNVGQGIPATFRDRVFKPFSQATPMSDRRSGGTGLGLSITKQIVEQMGGEIGFESVTGGTTTFWFTVQACAGLQ